MPQLDLQGVKAAFIFYALIYSKQGFFKNREARGGGVEVILTFYSTHTAYIGDTTMPKRARVGLQE